VPVRIIPCVSSVRRRVLMYSDATGVGELAWIVTFESHRLYAGEFLMRKHISSPLKIMMSNERCMFHSSNDHLETDIS